MNWNYTWILVAAWLGVTIPAKAAVVPYAITITTAYALADPFPKRVDQAWTAPDTGYAQIANTGSSTFSGTVGTTAVSAFAGDLSFSLSGVTLAPGESLSIAIPDDASDVGGFNGPAYFYRPGVEIWLRGEISDGVTAQAADLLVADRDIHSGAPRVDPFGLLSDSFVLQGGDPWGFDAGDDFELSQAYGVYVFRQEIPAPAPLPLLLIAILATAGARRHRAGASAVLEGRPRLSRVGGGAIPRPSRPVPNRAIDMGSGVLVTSLLRTNAPAVTKRSGLALSCSNELCCSVSGLLAASRLVWASRIIASSPSLDCMLKP